MVKSFLPTGRRKSVFGILAVATALVGGPVLTATEAQAARPAGVRTGWFTYQPLPFTGCDPQGAQKAASVRGKAVWVNWCFARTNTNGIQAFAVINNTSKLSIRTTAYVVEEAWALSSNDKTGPLGISCPWTTVKPGGVVYCADKDMSMPSVSVRLHIGGVTTAEGGTQGTDYDKLLNP